MPKILDVLYYLPIIRQYLQKVFYSLRYILDDETMNILRRGRLSAEPDEDIERFTSSMEADRRLFDADIEVDRAHVVMLREQDIINAGDCAAILSGLEKIKAEGISALDTSYEDAHIALEARLIEMVGEDTGA